MKMHNLYGTQKAGKDTSGAESSSDSEDDDEDEDEDKKPQLELAMVPHYGGINRVRVYTSFLSSPSFFCSLIYYTSH